MGNQGKQLFLGDSGLNRIVLHFQMKVRVWIKYSEYISMNEMKDNSDQATLMIQKPNIVTYIQELRTNKKLSTVKWFHHYVELIHKF